MSPEAAWTFLILFYMMPLAHVLLSPRAGPWHAPEGGRCPFSPRVGWIVIVLLLGAIGWLMFIASLRRRRRGPAGPG